MTPERWRQVEEVVQEALVRDAANRAAYLSQACQGDESLRQEVEALLKNEVKVERFIENPALEVAAARLAEEGAPSWIGKSLGPYKVVERLGAGGMGEVYRARDSRLGREVAIKVVTAGFAAEGERLRRFEQEARAVGQLNHPNILMVHDIGTHESVPYMVSELLEGETLRVSLDRGALPVGKALDYATQIARGLAAAHEKGIVHRDLKPENVFLSSDGRVKILDFGLAKLKAPRSRQEVVSEIPGNTLHTHPGMVMGTTGYMSPEQVQGREVDHRSDIFSFGVMLYEMLLGQRPFRGESAVEVMNAILKEEPPELGGTEASVHPALARVIAHCLEKSPDARFQSITDVAFNLEGMPGLLGSTPLISTSASKRVESHKRLRWVVGATMGLAALVLSSVSLIYFRSAPADLPTVRSFILPPDNWSFCSVRGGGDLSLGPVAVSPDGRRLAFVAESPEGNRLIWIRSLDALPAEVLPGTEGAGLPFWSPDSRFVAFFADRKLKKIDVSGGPPVALCDAPDNRGGTWSQKGVIVFAPSIRELYWVSDTGGVATAITNPDESRMEKSHRFPWFLPDGHTFLYLAISPANEREPGTIYAASLESSERKLILKANSNVVYSQGHLLFLREDTLMAQRFDPQQLATIADAFPIAQNVLFSSLTYRGVFSASESGILAYESGADKTDSQLTWLDRTGKTLGVLGEAARHRQLRLSPDGKRVAVTIAEPRTGDIDIWAYDVARGLKTRFTFDAAEERALIWSPDGNHIFYNSEVKGFWDLYKKAADGIGKEELLLESKFDKYPNSLTPDGRFLIYHTRNTKTAYDLWVLPLSGKREPFPFLQTEFNEAGGQLSPDGRWLVYQSNVSGQSEIYVAAFPGPGLKRRISSSGGARVQWRADGKELFFQTRDDKFMAVEMRWKGGDLEIGAPRQLFELRWDSNESYAVSPDGQRFLVNKAVQVKGPAPLTLVTNWTAGLKKG
ncbi:MAG: protein kinase [Acidobacteria bacterium]|nr:protein kinase [Acidobacteriota bacterium]